MKTFLSVILCVLCVSSAPAQEVSIPAEKKGVIIRTKVVDRANPKVAASASVSSAASAAAKFTPKPITPIQWKSSLPDPGIFPVYYGLTFEPFGGKQEQWDIVPKAEIRNGFAVPVYLTLADRPYTVLGCIWFRTPPPVANPREEVIKLAAKDARDRGADAIMLNPQLWARMDFYMAATAVKWR